jgi:hypothetical protein
MIACLFVMLAVASSAAPPPCATPFPNPVINYKGATNGVTGYLDIWFGVGNFAQYDNSLFVASPELPACGLNKNASRTWVDVYTDTGAYIYGYCALTQNAQLQKLGFPWKKTNKLPKGFFIRMRDRKCNKVVQSNTHIGF